MTKKISVKILKRALQQLPKKPTESAKFYVDIEDLLLRESFVRNLKPDKLVLDFTYDTDIKEWILNL